MGLLGSGDCILLIVIISAITSVITAQPWNCLTGTPFCILNPPESRSWHGAAAHCFQRNGGLVHLDNFPFIRSTHWPSAELWIGLGWVNGRLQWMSQIPREENREGEIETYAKNRTDPAKLCYLMHRDGTIQNEFCRRRLNYVCVKSVSVNEDLWNKATVPESDNIVPELIPSKDIRIHHAFFIVEPAVNMSLECKIPSDALTKCTKIHYRWLRNGAYKPEFDGKLIISNANESNVNAKLMWISNLLGKVSCEVFCFSSGKSFQSKEAILVLHQSISLRVEFQLETINLTAMRIYFDEVIGAQFRFVKPDKSISGFDFDLPMLSYPENSTDIFSFYAVMRDIDDEVVKRKVYSYLSGAEPDHMISAGSSRQFQGFFKSIRVFVLNYCISREGGNAALVYANQPTLAPEFENYNFRNESKILGCHQYASYQCRADWMNQPTWEKWSPPINCAICMDPFLSHEDYCLRKVPPQPFPKTIAECMAQYQQDQVNATWDLSRWIQLSLDWIEEQKKFSKSAETDLQQIWLPVQRRTHLGPLQPIWPWSNFSGTVNSGLQVSSWEEEMKAIVNRSGFREDWSQLDPSLFCLMLDTQSRTMKSASCQQRFPMICIRSRLNLSLTVADSVIKSQCPWGWQTSSLGQRNYCYKIVFNEILVTFDEADEECQKLGGQLAIAEKPSTLTVIIGIHARDGTLYSRKFGSVWIGLRKKDNRLEWMDNSSWTYLHQLDKDLNSADETNVYGVSLEYKLDYSRPGGSMIRWRGRPKGARLNEYICQKEIAPQREVALQMSLSEDYKPRVSIQPISFHLRGVDQLLNLNKTTPIEAYTMSSLITKTENLFLSKMTCFMTNQTSTVDFSSFNTNETTMNYYTVISRPESFIPERWEAAETSCETWDKWSPESLQTSWILSGNLNNEREQNLSSLIVRLRHRFQTYVSEDHDATFKMSGYQRKLFATSLYNVFSRESLERHPYYRRYSNQSVNGNDPVAFEREPNSNRPLLIICYRLVFNLNTNDELNSENIFESTRDEETIFQDFHALSLSVFDSSNNGTELDFVSVRSTKFCASERTTEEGRFLGFGSRPIPARLTEIPADRLPPTEPLSNELYWPKSEAGALINPTPHCITRGGYLLRRRCLGDRSSGLHWESLETKASEGSSLCVGRPSELFHLLLASMEMDNVTRILQMIRQDIKNWDPSIADLELLAQALRRCSYVDMGKDLNMEDLNNLQTIIQQINSLEMDKLIGAQESPSFSSNLAKATELLFARINARENNGNFNSTVSQQRFRTELPFVAGGSWDRQNEENILGFTAAINNAKITRSNVLLSNATYEEVEQSNVVVLLPFQKTETPGRKQEQVTFLAYPDTRLIDALAASGKFSSAVYLSDPSEPEGYGRNEKLFTGNGGMVQVVLSPQPHQLTNPVTLFFRPKYPSTPENQHLLRCVFWSEQMNAGSGGWSIDGCWHEGTRNGLEVCRCNHLSTFTLLVSRSEKHLQSTIHGAILNVITLIGSILSIVGLSLILLTFLIFPSWRKPLGHKFLVQLSLALIVLLITFISGVDNIKNIQACRATAVFLHYFLLTAFCWMTVEAYQQYKRLVIVFGTNVPRFLLKASLIAWGVPFLLVGAVLVYDLDSYTGDEGYCWLRPTVFYISVLGPIATLMLINLSFFVLVFRSIATSGRGLRTNQSEMKQAKEKLVACFLNFVLLGLSWIFGFFAIGPTNSLFYSYMFCLTTTLQGFLLFLLYVIRDPLTRQLWIKWLGIGKLTPNIRLNEPKVKLPAGSSTSGNTESYSRGTSERTGNNESTSTVTLPLM